jgi:hypothetical protein
MPILTEQELQDIVNKETEAKSKIDEQHQFIKQLNDEKEEAESQRKGLLVSTIILGILFISLLFMIFFQPSLFNINQGIKLESDEVVINKKLLEEDKDRIIELETQLSNSTNPLNLKEFYAVQLGAFKKFNTKLSSDSYKVVHNANFKDFNLFTLGVFETEAEAEQLRKIVRKLNFQDAFVGYYKDGQRVKSNY